MRPLLTTFLLLTAALVLAGCASNAEDKAFFENGWLKPDAAADQRMYGSKVQPGGPVGEPDRPSPY